VPQIYDTGPTALLPFRMKACLEFFTPEKNPTASAGFADITKYMVMSRYQNADRSQNIKIGNSAFERVAQFIYVYLGNNLINQNSIQEEIKSRLKSGNASFNSVQNLLSSSLLSKNLKNGIYVS
jgi:hypothetical protein